MARLSDLDRSALDESTRAVRDEIAATRQGIVGGPFDVWLRVPEIAAAAHALSDAVRARGSTPRDVFELLVLVCTKHWEAEYPWAVHRPLAVTAGVGEEVVTAIEAGVEPDFGDDKRQELAYDFVHTLLEEHRIEDDLYRALAAEFGERGLIELTTIVGFYSTASMMTTVFEVDLP